MDKRFKELDKLDDKIWNQTYSTSSNLKELRRLL
jgi:hypothetical protein